jgi:outer membrane receptor protein involved in Fe transport
MTLSKNGLKPASMLSVSAVALLVGSADPAKAQQAYVAPPVATIEVTGTRIREPNLTSPAPVTSVSAEEMKFQGTTSIETALNNLPQVTADETTTQSGDADGTAGVDLRGLGSNRTLVLIDGKRLGPGDPSSFSGSAADLNFIPSPLVESIEVLTGGASTDYGSDALAGVVNFKMKHDFEGVEFDQEFTIAQHTNNNGTAATFLRNNNQSVISQGQTPGPLPIPGDNLDGFTRLSTAIVGANFSDGAGNVTAYVTALHLDPIAQSNRDFSACATTTNYAATELECGGSENNPQGYFIVPGNENILMIDPNSAHNAPGTSKWVPWDGRLYDYGPTNFLQRDDDRYTGGILAHDKLESWADLYTSIMFAEDQTDAQIAPSGLFSGGGITGNVTINCANPLMSASQAADIGCPKNRTGSATFLMPGLRFSGFPRVSDYRHADSRFVVGSRGDIGGNWTYDASIVYWDAVYHQAYLNDVSGTKVTNALDVVNVHGVPTCVSALPGGSDPSCIPLNIFQQGGLTTAAANSLFTSAYEKGQLKETVVEGNLSGDFGEWGGTSPFAKDAVSAVFGYDYRYEHLELDADQEFQTGDLLGGAGPTPSITGAYDVDEYYGELHIPVVQDQPFMKSITIDTGIRRSFYSVYSSSNTYQTSTWKLQGEWQPIDDIRFRGGYNRAARAPNIYELFLPNGVTTGGFNDPCAGANPAVSEQGCALSGVTAAEYGHVPQCPAEQCSVLSGGNIALKPEEADTWTWGFVLTPTMLPGFTASADYWDIQIDNAIEDYGIGGNIVLNECISGLTSFCGDVRRGPQGILFGQFYVSSTAINAAVERTNGIDLAANYRRKLEDLWLPPNLGAVSLDFVGTYTISNITKPYPGAPNYDCVGLYGITCAQPTPSWRHKARATWETPWDVTVSLDWRHLSGSSYDANTSNPLLTQGYFEAVDAKIPAYDYFDISGTWQVRDGLELRAGINNLFDKDPPIQSSDGPAGASWGNANTYPGVYDSLGRVIFVGVNAKF